MARDLYQYRFFGFRFFFIPIQLGWANLALWLAFGVGLDQSAGSTTRK